jgi:hypothetical protein
MEMGAFILELTQNVMSDGWQRTADEGYLYETKSFAVRAFKSDESTIMLVVQDRTGEVIAHAEQKQGADGADDDITLRLALLYQRLDAKPPSYDSMNEVLQQLRQDSLRPTEHTGTKRETQRHFRRSAQHADTKREPQPIDRPTELDDAIRALLINADG